MTIPTPARAHSGEGRERGFTLIELMITMAIIAMLSALAYPSYRNYVIRGQLVDGTNGLSAMRANMERYYQDNRSYASVTNGSTTFNPPCATSSTVGNFTISCGTPAPSATAYIAQAVGGGPVNGFTFTIDQNGGQTTTVTSPPAPAAFQNCATAWVTKPGGC